jgi:hypothetical protein
MLVTREKAERYRAWIMEQLGQHDARNITEAILDSMEPRDVEHAVNDTDLEMTRICHSKFSEGESRGCVFRDNKR